MSTPSDTARQREPQAAKLQAAKDAVYRQHIMEAAEELFAGQGFSNTKMQDIARASGLSLGTLYQTYAGKQALYRQLLKARAGEMLDAVMAQGAPVLENPTSVVKLLWLTEVHIRFLLEHDSYLRIQLQQGYAWYHEAAQPGPDEQKMWQQGIELIKQVLDWGMEQGYFVAGDTGDQARLMIAMQQTRLANWVIAGMEEPHHHVVARIQADFIRQFCHPRVTAGMLSADGAHLSESTTEGIRALGDATPG